MTRTVFMAGLLSTLLCAGCGYSHSPVPFTTPSVAKQKTEDADIGSEADPLRVSGGVMAGQILTKVVPVIPTDALRGHISGAIVLAIVVDRAGRVVHSSVISGPEPLRGPTLNAVNQRTYKPFLLDGQPVFVQTTVTINMDFGAGR